MATPTVSPLHYQSADRRYPVSYMDDWRLDGSEPVTPPSRYKTCRKPKRDQLKLACYEPVRHLISQGASKTLHRF